MSKISQNIFNQNFDCKSDLFHISERSRNYVSEDDEPPIAPRAKDVNYGV
jgi:hypothetical protein